MARARLRLSITSLSAGFGLALLLAARPHSSASATGTDVATVAAWAVAAACCAWIAVAALAAFVALGVRRPRLASALAGLSPRFVLRFAGLAVAGSSIVLTAVPARAVVAPDEPVVRAPVVAAPARPPQPLARARAAPPRSTHVVLAGDNLWSIARGALAAGTNRTPSDEEVARYWRAVIDANRTTLRSGDPNVIFVGETVTLPRRG
jgi:hypothetical protein